MRDADAALQLVAGDPHAGERLTAQGAGIADAGEHFLGLAAEPVFAVISSDLLAGRPRRWRFVTCLEYPKAEFSEPQVVYKLNRIILHVIRVYAEDTEPLKVIQKDLSIVLWNSSSSQQLHRPVAQEAGRQGGPITPYGTPLLEELGFLLQVIRVDHG